MDNDSKRVIPGDILLAADEMTRPGMGTFELHGNVYASLMGFLFIRKEIMNDKEIRVVEVRRSAEKQDHVVPYVGGIVTARVLNIGHKFAKCELLCVENSPLSNEYSANLRREDIRSFERDKIELPKCVQPGDIIIARVISFGDNQSSFLLSTAEDQLGVVSAFSDNDEKLVIVDWNTMKNASTVSADVQMNPVLNDTNYAAAPVSFFGNPYPNAHAWHPQFPHSRSYPSLQDIHPPNDYSANIDYSVSRVVTPGSSPIPNIWDSYDDERPETPSFVGSGVLRVLDSQHYEMVTMVRNALTDADRSANRELEVYRPSSVIPPNITEEFTARPGSSDVRSFPIKPADSEECIIRRNQSVYLASHISGTTSKTNVTKNGNPVDNFKIVANASPIPTVRVPFSSQMKWTRTVVNSRENPDSSTDLDCTSPNKTVKSSTALNAVQLHISSSPDGTNMPIATRSEDLSSKTVLAASENGHDILQHNNYVKQQSNIDRRKPYVLPRRSQLSLRNINGKTYRNDSTECFTFASGFCTAGLFCRFTHNGSTAHSERTVCSRLLKGLCRPDNESCQLDHSLLVHQYPICSFYLREDCSENEKCKLLHVKHAPTAAPCMEFNKGICFNGIECEQPHRYLYKVIKSCGCYSESSRENDTSPSSIEDSSLPDTIPWIV